jgi:hypothetical protein
LPFEIDYPRDFSFPLKHVVGNKKQYLPGKVTSDEFYDIRALSRLIINGFYIDEYGFDCVGEKCTLYETQGLCGPSIEKERVQLSLVKFFEANRIAYAEPRKTIIEGGNIHFLLSNNKAKAIIGDHSLLLTYLVTLLRNEWPSEINDNKDDDLQMRLHPHLERNENLLRKLLAGRLTEEECLNLELASLKELAEDEKLLAKGKSRIISERLRWCKNLIALELELNVEDLIFIPQRNYHIDLDLFVTAKEKIVLRSPVPSKEEKIWVLQYNVLTRNLGEEFLVIPPADLFDGILFCGLPIPSKNYFVFPYLVEEDDLA